MDLSDEKRHELVMKEVAGLKKACPKDYEFMKDGDFLQLFLRTARESFANGGNAMMQDGKMMTSPFGFRIEDIRPDLPFQLWYGKQDVNVPLNHGLQIAARLGDRAHLRVEDETHLTISALWREEILKGIVESM